MEYGHSQFESVSASDTTSGVHDNRFLNGSTPDRRKHEPDRRPLKYVDNACALRRACEDEPRKSFRSLQVLIARSGDPGSADI